MATLFIKNFIYTLLLPGVVTGVIPFLILNRNGDIPISSDPTSLIAGFIISAVGLIVLIRCIIQFALEGKGTLSATDPTKELVYQGLYQYSRNPMYMGVIFILTGESVLAKSPELLIYIFIVFFTFNLFIIYFEEPRLKKDFGIQYTDYCRKVRRWL